MTKTLQERKDEADMKDTWQKEFRERFNFSLIKSVIDTDMTDDETWFAMRENIIIYIQDILDKQKAELLKSLDDNSAGLVKKKEENYE